MKTPDWPYVPIKVRSCFSFGYGCLTPEAICRLARLRDFPAVGMVDRGNFYGLVRFLKAAERESVKPVVGMSFNRGGAELCSAYVLDRRGFVRLAEIVSSLDAVDPLENLVSRGWPGLALVSSDRAAVERLAARQSCDLYVGLTYGFPFQALARFSRSSGLPLLAVNDACCMDPGDADCCDLLRAAERNCTVEELPPRDRTGASSLLAGSEQMQRYFSAVPEALLNARRLVGRASSESILSGRPLFPSYCGLSEVESFRLLRRLCLDGALRRYPEPRHPAPLRPDRSRPGGGALRLPPPSWRSRLERELEVIRRRGFAGYFLVVRDIVSRCPRTCGRGSSAASIVSYLLGITHVDPLRHNLLFERFLNLHRSDPPDIDVDFPWDEREAVLRHVFSRYAGRAGMVADHVTFGPRSAVREAARALGLGAGEIGKMVRLYRYGERERLPARLLEAAERIRSLPRNLGTHCGGVVITPRPITRYTHVQASPLGYPLIAWDKDSAQEAGLVKIDLLGNRSLGVLRDTIELANRPQEREAELTWEGLDPLGSRETSELIAAGRTLGVFYIESPATRQLLRKMGRGDYEHLVIASSIIRPAASRCIREFLRRLHGGRYRALTPQMSRILADTYGIMVYQEDVCRVAAAVAGFSPGEAEELRRTLAGKSGARRLEGFRRRFFLKGSLAGSPRRVLEQVWRMILTFRGYSFCKAHSASYALAAYKLAYLKRFFPLEFFVSVINNGGGYYSRQTYLNECRRLGFRILLPDVNASAIGYTVEQGALRIGLGQLLRIRRSFLRTIIVERQRGGPYRCFDEFLRRTGAGLGEIRVLIRSGALDCLAGGLSRPQLFWLYFRRQPADSLFIAPPAPASPASPPVPASIGDYPRLLKLLDELRTLGLVASCHPVAIFRRRARSVVAERRLPPLILSRELPGAAGRRVSLAGLLVSGKEVVASSGEPMVFVSFEDEHSVFETVFFPAVFRRTFRRIDRGGIFLLSGMVVAELGACSLTVERVSNLYRPDGGSKDPPGAGLSAALAGGAEGRRSGTA
jgi:DNA-directed DNA polymerase III PolC